jgi:hypothetical protein
MGYYDLVQFANQSAGAPLFVNLLSEGLFSQQVAAYKKFKVPSFYGAA